MTNNNNRHRVFCVIGRTGSGKSSIVNKAAEELNMKVLKSYTTRKPRTNELNQPTDHIFINESEFTDILKKENFVAYTEINNCRYFTTMNQLMKSDFYVIDPIGYKCLIDSIDSSLIDIIPVYVNALTRNREHRYIKRNNTTEYDFFERNTSESEQFDDFFDEFCLNNKCKVINNNELIEDAIANFELFVLETIKAENK